MNASTAASARNGDGSRRPGRSSTGKRKYHQKLKSGCLTCKKRRVKCDETRPSCRKCEHMGLVCGYTVDEDPEGPCGDDGAAPKRIKPENDSSSLPPGLPTSNTSKATVQQETPSVTPSPVQSDAGPAVPPGVPSSIANLLNAGNLNNINLSHLVNNLSGLGDLGSLGNLANLSSLATLAKLPIDLSNLGSLLDLQMGSFSANGSGNSAPRDPYFPVNSASAGPQIPNEFSPNATSALPSISPNVNTNPSPNLAENPLNHPMAGMGLSGLNMLDLRLMFHYTSQVSNTITGAGISDTNIWNHDIPMLAFSYPFLMHLILAFSATHLSRTEKGLDQCVTCHRGDALRLLREAVLDINADNTDALVASALILIMDSLANASFPLSTLPKSLPALAWIFHVKGAATILTAVWPLTESSRFYKFISVDLGDLGDITNQKANLDGSHGVGQRLHSDLECHDSEIADMFPVELNSPYLITLAYLNKLHKERYKSDFILRIFAFPALLDKSFLSLLMTGDIKSMRIMRLYYKLLRSFTTEMKDKVWFLEGVSQVLPVDVEEYAGGAGGMHMMLDFLGGGPSIVDDHEIDEELSKFDPTGQLANKLIDTNNLPSDITSNLDVMQGDNGFVNMK